MREITFEQRAVAFIDVLGFKSVVEAADLDGSKLAELAILIDLLENVVPKLDDKVSKDVPKDLFPKHIYISDSIILSAPLTSCKMKSYKGLSTLVMRVIQISRLLLCQGYLIRGGISVGSVWHTDSNIVGPAYQEAYRIETKTCAPRVELSPEAKKLWIETEGCLTQMCLDYMDRFMVNVLLDAYIEDRSHGAAERAFAEYSRTIDDNIDDTSHPEPVRCKWQWFKEYLSSEIERKDFIRAT